MAKISLRAYHQAIEKMIDNGQLEEASAHCQYILKTYPKALESYRVLGRAFLEQRRFDEAADIFQRVLLAVPDDFIGNLGMSMVREEQKNLDAAIYHMERAFDVQSANAAIQGELRRLYGRRDGMEPPKIRLTRGALASMYAKGAQFDQAIMEIRSILADEPGRTDMQVLLARVYYRAGKRVEATELCSTLIKKYPFTLDANRIMGEILAQAGRTDSAQPFVQRVHQLDPYAAFVTGSLFDSDKVGDNAIAFEKLDWQPGEAPAWTAPTQSQSALPSAQPAWLSEPEPARSVMEEATPAIPTSEDNIPDFLKQAGWGTSTGAFQEGPVSFEEPEETPAQSAALDELATAEMPDWLKAIAPPSDETSGFSASAPAEAEADMDFLSNLGVPSTPVASAPEPTAGSFDWMAGSSETPVTSSQPPAAESMDWLGNLQEPAAPAAAEPATDGLPDWMKGFGEPQAQPASVTPAQPAEDVPDWMRGAFDEQPAPAPKAEEPADWLSGLSAAATVGSAASDDMDWLKNLGEPETPASTVGEPAAPAAEPTDTRTKRMTGWLRSLEEDQPAAQEVPAMPDMNKPQAPSGDELSALSSGPGISSGDQDDALAWLESLAAKQGAKSEELLTKPSERLDSAPDWVSKVGEPPAAPATPAAPVELSASSTGFGTSAAEQDDGLAWLESLAAKQGAKAEELLTKPSERLDSAPAWVSKVGETPAKPAELPAPYQPEKPIEVEAQAADELSPLASGAGTTASEQDDALAWLENLAAKQGAKPEELLTKPEERRAEKPDWVGTVENKPTQTSPLVSVPGTQPAEQDQSTAWLESLAANQGAQPEELITEPEVRQSEEPDWLGRLGEETPLTSVAPVPASTTAEDDAFAWLEALAAKQGAKSEELLTKPEERREEKPDWVAQVPAEPVSTTPVPVESESAWFTPEPEKTAEPEAWFTPEPEKPADSQQAWFTPEPEKAAESEQPWFTPEPEKVVEPEQPWYPPVTEPAPVVETKPAAADDDIAAWLHQLDEEDQVSENKPAAEPWPAEEAQPEFLTALEFHAAKAQDEDLPEWLRGDLEEKTPTPVVTPSQWMPEESPPAAPVPVQTPPPPVPVAQAEEKPQAAAPTPVSKPAAQPKPAKALKRDMSYLTGTKESEVFEQARTAMTSNNLRGALDEYAKLIKRGRMLDEVIGDLRDATYSHPVDVVVWQTLGDAYMRAGRLQEALNSYTKAEELLR